MTRQHRGRRCPGPDGRGSAPHGPPRREPLAIAVARSGSWCSSRRHRSSRSPGAHVRRLLLGSPFCAGHRRGVMDLRILCLYEPTYGVLKQLGVSALEATGLDATEVLSIAHRGHQSIALVPSPLLALGWAPVRGWSPPLVVLALVLARRPYGCCSRARCARRATRASAGLVACHRRGPGAGSHPDGTCRSRPWARCTWPAATLSESCGRPRRLAGDGLVGRGLAAWAVVAIGRPCTFPGPLADCGVRYVAEPRYEQSEPVSSRPAMPLGHVRPNRRPGASERCPRSAVTITTYRWACPRRTPARGTLNVSVVTPHSWMVTTDDPQLASRRSHEVRRVRDLVVRAQVVIVKRSRPWSS